MSKYSTTEYNRYERLRSRICDIYSRAKSFKMTHAQLLERMTTEVYSSADYRRLSQARKTGLYEVVRCLSDQINRYELEWVLGTSEGPIPEGRTHDWSTGKLSQLAESKALYGSHMWAGTDKLWGEWKAL